MSCSMKCSKACEAKASKAASMVCDKSGKVSYLKKDVCENTGRISYTEVKYDEAKAQFVDIDETNIKASSMTKAGCSASGKKAGCCSKKASAQVGSNENVDPTTSAGEGTN